MKVEVANNLGYYKSVIQCIVQGLRDKKSDSQIARELSSRGMFTTTHQKWAGKNVGNLLSLLRHNEANRGSFQTAFNTLIERGEISADEVATIKKYRPRPSRGILVSEKAAYVSAIKDFGKKGPFLRPELTEELVSRGLSIPTEYFLADAIHAADFIARRVELDGSLRTLYADRSVSTKDAVAVRVSGAKAVEAIAEKIVAHQANKAEAKKDYLLAFMAGSKIVHIELRHSHAEYRDVYAQACVNLVENGVNARMGGDSFSSLQTFIQ